MKVDIYNMQLHEIKELDRDKITWDVTRVPGGWIYSYVRLDCNSMVSQFVPYAVEPIKLNDSDIANIEAMHDLLLDHHGYDKDMITLRRTRKTISKMYKLINNK